MGNKFAANRMESGLPLIEKQMQVDSTSLQSSGRKDWFTLSILGFSLALNVFLGWKIQSLNSYIQSKSRHSKILAGTTVSEITALGLDGESKLIAWNVAEQPTVLYVFSPTCVWCDRNLNNVKALKNGIGQSHRFIGISLSDSGLSEYLRSHQLDFPVYKQPSKEAIKQLDLGGTPQTIVISSQGKVLKNWVGAYGSTKPEIETYFGVQLPGV
jgi:thioredoxin-related protein